MPGAGDVSFSLLCHGWRLDVVRGRSARAVPTRTFLRRSYPQGREAGRSSSTVTRQNRIGHQPQRRQGAGSDSAADHACPRRRGNWMKSQASGRQAVNEANAAPEFRGRLFRKYVAFFAAVVCGALVTNGLFDIWFSYREQRVLLIRIQRGQAESAAARISQFVQEIEDQLARATQLP